MSEGLYDEDPSQRAKGYLFLYFYGIERRVLAEGKLDLQLLGKVEHLLKVYGPANPKNSFTSYLSDFLHFASYKLGHSAYRSLWPRYLTLHEQKVSEDVLSLILANLHELGESLDCSMALRIAQLHEDSKKSVVVSRSGERFHQLFENKFNEIYAESFPLKAGKRNRKIRYNTANASLIPRYSHGSYSNVSYTVETPNVLALKSQFKKLPQIWNSCIEELSSYSRAIRSVTENHDSSLDQRLKAYLALPESIRCTEEHPLRGEFNQLLSASENAENLHIIPCSAIATILGIDERPTLTKVQSQKVSSLIESVGYIHAPSPSHISLPYKWGQDIVVSDRKSSIDTDCPKLLGALRLLYLTIMVAASDGDVADEEMELFAQSLEALEFNEEQKDEIGLTIKALLLDTNMATKNLNKICKEIPKENRKSVFRHLVSVAAADEIITSDEKHILKRMQKAMGLPVEILNEVLSETQEFKTIVGSVKKRL